jgi:predicted transcriptional regulator of viral defense system
MRAIEKIRKQITRDIFDYTQLMDVLKDYRKPRDVVSSLLREEQIIRIRKGLYIFGNLWQRNVISREILANLIYGPSVVSLDYALSWYGLIPERILQVTSVTTGRSREYETPLGRFSYAHLSEICFSQGITTINEASGNWLVAEPLKALTDKVRSDTHMKVTSPSSYDVYLFDDLRIDETLLAGLIKKANLAEIGKAYNNRKINWLIDFLIKRFAEKI